MPITATVPQSKRHVSSRQRPGKTLVRPLIFWAMPSNAQVQTKENTMLNVTSAAAAADRQLIRAGIASLASLARQALLRRKVRKALHALDDHMLKDIGISRSDIERVSRTTGPAHFTRFGR